MKNKWITKVIYLNKYTKWKTKEELLQRLQEIKFDELFIDELIKVKYGNNNNPFASITSNYPSY